MMMNSGNLSILDKHILTTLNCFQNFKNVLRVVRMVQDIVLADNNNTDSFTSRISKLFDASEKRFRPENR